MGCFLETYESTFKLDTTKMQVVHIHHEKGAELITETQVGNERLPEVGTSTRSDEVIIGIITIKDRPAHAVSGCRAASKADMALNDATPAIEVDPETYEVRADGELLTCEPAESLPMAQRYFLF